MLEPKEVAIDLPNGTKKVYILSKFPAIAGREITTQYPTSAAPKIGDYKTNEELMLKLMCYVGVPVDGRPEPQMLVTSALVDNHVPDFETLLKIEWEMMKYNCSFFNNGKAFDFLGLLAEKSQALIASMLTAFLDQSSKKDMPPGTN